MLFKQGKVLVLCLLITLLVREAYSLEFDVLYAENHCNELKVNSVPPMVLVGTEVQNISEFEEASTGLDGVYTAEVGGAILTLTYIKRSNQFSRTFQEPGEIQRTNHYSSACTQGEYSFVGEALGLNTEQGLLLWEPRNKIDGLPNDMWILYKKIDENK